MSLLASLLGWTAAARKAKQKKKKKRGLDGDGVRRKKKKVLMGEVGGDNNKERWEHKIDKESKGREGGRESGWAAQRWHL